MTSVWGWLTANPMKALSARIHSEHGLLLCAAFLMALHILLPAASRAGEWPLFDRVQTEVQRRGLDGDHAEIELSAARGLIRSVDPLAAIMTDAEKEYFQRSRRGVAISAGILIEKDGQGRTLVSERLDSDCALEEGAVLLAVDGVPTADTDVFGIYEQLRGRMGAPVELLASNTVSHAVSTATVARAEWELPPLMGSELLPGGIRYLRLRGFYQPFDAARDSIAAALGQESIGVVIDLRAAGGDSLAAVLETADLIMPPTSNLFTYVSLSGGGEERYGLREKARSALPLVVLQDQDTAAAAELFTALCRAGTAKVVLVGGQTSGDPVLRGFTMIAPGSNLYLLERRLETADGSVYDGMSGVEPDIAVPDESSSVWSEGMGQERYYRRKAAEGEEVNKALAERIGADRFLRRAVDILIGLKALGYD